MAERINEFSGEIKFASGTSGVRDFTPNLVRSLSEGIGFNQNMVDISVPLACDRMWYFRKNGVNPQDTSQDRYLYTISEIRSAGSKRILQEKLAKFGKPLELFDQDLKIKSRVDCVYSYEEEDEETHEVSILDQLVCIRFVPYFVLKQLKNESEITPDARRLLIWNMGIASNMINPEGREFNVVGANLLYVSLDGGKSRGMQFERKLPWNGETFKEFITLVDGLEKLATSVEEGILPDPNPSNNLICQSFCQYWRMCEYGAQIHDRVDNQNGSNQKNNLPQPRVRKSKSPTNQLSFDLKFGTEIKIENIGSPEKICFDCGAPLVVIGSNGNTRYKCPNCGDAG